MLKTLKILLLVAASLLIYGQTFGHDFVFDDYTYIVNDSFIRQFSRVHLILHTFPMTRTVGFYTFALNYYFTQLHPWSYHVFNFLVHLAGTFLVWALAARLFQMYPVPGLKLDLAYCTAFLFLVHPGQTQAVSYIAQRFESMAAVFYLATVYAYLRGRLSDQAWPKALFWGTACMTLLLGLLTKEVMITVPATIWAVEWILFPKQDKKIFYLFLALGSVLLYLLFAKLVHADPNIHNQSVWANATPSLSHDGEDLTPSGYVLTQMRVFLTFLRLFVLPIHQNLDYDYPASSGLLHPPLTLAGLIVLTVLILLIARLRLKAPLTAFGLAWTLITFSINMVPRSNVIFEHKFYLISFGLFLAFVNVLGRMAPQRPLFLRTIGMVLAVLALMTYARNKVWQNELVLWDNIIHESPHKARAYGNRGFAYFKQGDYDRAMSDFNKALEINPNYVEALNNRGCTYLNQGRWPEALADLNRSIRLSPNEKAFVNRGIIENNLGHLDQAIDDYTKAIFLNPMYAQAYNNRGVALGKTGQLAKAMVDFDKAIEIDPNMDNAYQNRSYAEKLLHAAAGRAL